MEEEKQIKYSLLTAGSLLVALSFTLVGRYSFQGRILYVFFGYLLFVTGYKMCWYGVHQRGGFERFREVLVESAEDAYSYLKTDPQNYFLILLGVYLTSYGSVLFTEALANPEIPRILLAGVAVFAGYVMAHEGVNEVPV
ncbi:MAG: hypothetical protein ABEJ36_02100 [Candidatus Nanosalina sp.]